MPKRMSPEDRAVYYDFLKRRDGEECRFCGRKPTEKSPLQVDHIDGWETWKTKKKARKVDTTRLQLLCASCNRKKDPGGRPRQASEYVSLEKEREQAKSVEEAGTDIEAPATFRASRINEQRVRTWILGYLTVHKDISLQEAVRTGAEIAECSKQATRAYLDKMVSLVGPLKLTESEPGTWHLGLKSTREEA